MRIGKYEVLGELGAAARTLFTKGRSALREYSSVSPLSPTDEYEEQVD